MYTLRLRPARLPLFCDVKGHEVLQIYCGSVLVLDSKIRKNKLV